MLLNSHGMFMSYLTTFYKCDSIIVLDYDFFHMPGDPKVKTKLRQDRCFIDEIGHIDISLYITTSISHAYT